MLIHVVALDDFTARSSDELSLAKGDRVELLERDDDFGDGWYLGRHLINGNTGLFPEGQQITSHALICLLIIHFLQYTQDLPLEALQYTQIQEGLKSHQEDLQ